MSLSLIELLQGSTKTISFAFYADDGSPLNISGYTGYFTVRRNYSDTTGQAIINGPINILGDGTTGLANYTITTGESSNCVGNYYFAGTTLYGVSGDVVPYPADGLSILPSPQGFS